MTTANACTLKLLTRLLCFDLEFFRQRPIAFCCVRQDAEGVSLVAKEVAYSGEMGVLFIV